MKKYHNAFKVVEMFEENIAKYAGSKYAVAVDSCTNALLLACLYCDVRNGRDVILPKKTYVGVAYSVFNARGTIEFVDKEWKGIYRLNPYPIVDGARRFRRGMYEGGTLHCLSFHAEKHIPIGRGGMILTDSEVAVKLLRQMRYDGRSEGVPASEDSFDCFGYHFYMTPEQAARGLTLFHFAKDKDFKDLPNSDYPDLSKRFLIGNILKL